jgi:hypothetical protein
MLHGSRMLGESIFGDFGPRSAVKFGSLSRLSDPASRSGSHPLYRRAGPWFDDSAPIRRLLSKDTRRAENIRVRATLILVGAGVDLNVEVSR